MSYSDMDAWALSEEVAQLKRENAALLRDVRDLVNKNETLRAENAAMRERLHQIAEKMTAHIVANAALREDKARLDWLDSIGRNVKNVNMDGVWREWSHRDYLNTKASLRESIDSARKEAQP